MCCEWLVTRAWYGQRGHEWSQDAGMDVTPKVQELVAEGVAEVPASNDYFGDPAHNQKVLVIEIVTSGSGNRLWLLGEIDYGYRKTAFVSSVGIMLVGVVACLVCIRQRRRSVAMTALAPAE